MKTCACDFTLRAHVWNLAERYLCLHFTTRQYHYLVSPLSSCQQNHLSTFFLFFFGFPRGYNSAYKCLCWQGWKRAAQGVGEALFDTAGSQGSESHRPGTATCGPWAFPKTAPGPASSSEAGLSVCCSNTTSTQPLRGHRTNTASAWKRGNKDKAPRCIKS